MIKDIITEMRSIDQQLKSEFSIPFKLIENSEFMVLQIVVVPWKQRNTGIGNKFMKRLIQLAKKVQKDVFISPDDGYAEKEDMSKAQLIKWYKKLGFKNKAKSDFRSQNTMCYYTKEW